MLFKSSNQKRFKQSNELFDEQALLIAHQFELYGFKYLKSKKMLLKESASKELNFVLSFGTNRNNQQGSVVNFNVHFIVTSPLMQAWRKELYPQLNFSSPNDIITNVGLGYLTNQKSYNAGSWNLIETNYQEIVNIIKEYALPSFDKFENKLLILDEFSSVKPKEFISEVLAFEYMLCFGNISQAQNGLFNLLKQRNWLEDYKNLEDRIRNGGQIDSNQNYISNLIQIANYYKIVIK
ncbi:MAG: hypothetical protein CMO01_24390 [Thalassobius sp.]|nr:hypothetical protein [Thalassovita sp.]